MAVLIEAISVVIRFAAVEQKYPGGWNAFRAAAPNKTLCCDNEIVRLGFMTPDDVRSYVETLVGIGFVYLEKEEAVDLVVVDQIRGPTAKCPWIEFGNIRLAGNSLATCRLRGSNANTILLPEGWKYDGSLTQTYGFVPLGKESKSLRFLRHEAGLDVYMNLLTGREVFIGRTGPFND